MRAGEHGVVLTIDAEFSFTGSTAGRLMVEDPAGVVTAKTLSPLPSSGQTVDYTTVAGDFPIPGRYLLSLEVYFGAGKRLMSKTRPLQVEPTMQEVSS